jgi:hypothetical protein
MLVNLRLLFQAVTDLQMINYESGIGIGQHSFCALANHNVLLFFLRLRPGLTAGIQRHIAI